jgi:hypothetical protein
MSHRSARKSFSGGYAVGEIGVNVVNVLTGFEQAQAA